MRRGDYCTNEYDHCLALKESTDLSSLVVDITNWIINGTKMINAHRVGNIRSIELFYGTSASMET